MIYHPDRNKSVDAANKFIEIQSAYDLLINNQLRARYDQQLRGNFNHGNGSPKQSNEDKKNAKATKKPRDINAPFDHYSIGGYLEYSKNFEVLMRVIILAVPGFIASIFIASALSRNYDINVGDHMVAFPFLLFHIFVFLDCLLPFGAHYALPMNVIIYKSQNINELVLNITPNAAETMDYFKVKKYGFLRDSIYVSIPPEAFRTMQQFAIYKSLIFRNNFQIFSVTNGKISNLIFNTYKLRNICAIGVLLVLVDLFLIFSNTDNPVPYLAMLLLEYFYITYFFTSNKILTGGILGKKI